jgi:hypothetical protein
MKGVIVLALLTALAVAADTLELKTGERIEGVFRQANANGVVIEVGGQAVTMPLEKVRAIYFGPERPAAQASALSAPAVSAPPAYAEALDALRALRSVTRSGIGYRDYVPRVLDTRVKVDKYVMASDDPPALTSAIATAMREFEIVSSVWERFIRGSGTDPFTLKGLATSAEFSWCSAVQNRAKRWKSLWHSEITTNEVVGTLWACASAKITEPEQLVAH